MTEFGTINEVFQDTVSRFPDKTALIFNDQKYTFSELHKMVEQVAAYLYSSGISKQDRVIIYLPHLAQWVVIWLGLQRIGAAAVPVTHFYGHEELVYIGTDSEVETIFCNDKNVNQVITAAEKRPFKRIIVVGDKAADLPVVEGVDILSFDSIMQQKVSPLPAINIDKKDLAEILYTGGTTGTPKGVPISNINFLEAIGVKRNEIEPLVPKGSGVAVQGAPLNHIMGQELGLCSLLSGDTLVLLPRMDLDVLFSQIEKYKASVLFGTPTFCRMILEHDKLDNYNLNSLLYVFTAGEALPPEVAKRWFDRFKKPIYHGLGTTETCGGVAGTNAGEPFPEGTVGKVVPTKKVKLVNPETLEPVAVNEPGELLVHSENMVTGYWKKPEETARHFIHLDGKMWYRTGDIVRMDEEGWIFFVDRSVDMIKHKGYRVAATKVEAVLYKHDAVFECCVVGVPDEKVGEKIKAFIVTKEGMKNVTAEELIEWCSGRLSSYEVPNSVEFTDALPKSAVGKILRRKLRDQERQKQGQ
ncbi:MAG: class I adenylate-forming enzyme family protein [Dethiobacteria bacterium]|jgi:long-chain acyl-CoA synthetase